MAELSVLIPARNEMWLARTVEDVLSHIEADTEIIVVLDGAWADPGITQHKRVKVVYLPQAIGQRAATNLAARLSSAKYIMKLDAHCAMDQGFDRKLIESASELDPNVTQVPRQHNLHVFDWVCPEGHRRYQGPTKPCDICGKEMTKDVVWNAKRRLTEFWRFDSDLHFQYWGTRGKDVPNEETYPETMSMLGACWFMSRNRYWELEGLDEAHGSWGQMGTELSCKSWLSGGRVVTNRKTWFSHMFRTQGGDFSFPYKITSEQQGAAQRYSRELWRGNKWKGQKKPLVWMLDKFWPVPGWTEEQRDALRSAPVPDCGCSSKSVGESPTFLSEKGIIYYTDNQLEPEIDIAVRGCLEASTLPITAASLKPMKWDRANNIVVEGERGYLTMFKQILAALENSPVEIVFFCEHDVLYHQSHFEFKPPCPDKVYYNQNVWKVDVASGKALHYRCSQTSGLCGYRDTLIKHYRKRVELVEKNGFTRRMGFEPGTHNRPERVDDLKSETWMSEFPNVDIRHNKNLTPSRWKKEDFRNQKFCEGWTESDVIPGWGLASDILFEE